MSAATKSARLAPSRLDALLDLGRGLPWFLVTPFVRPWHLRWGSTPGEVASAMPGDALVAGAQFVATRAVTVDAPPERVWPWIVQVGYGRAGFYAYDALDNLGHPSAIRVVQELQAIEPGTWIPMAETVNEVTAFRVHAWEQERWLVWSKPDSTWAWRLEPIAGGRTRLVTRLKCRYDLDRPAAALLSILLLELGDFPMMRHMLLGIAARAGAAG
jgi:hypothetical protein